MASIASSTKPYPVNIPATLDRPGRLQLAINQVEYSNAPGGPVIHIFGRDRAGGAVRIDVTGFKPYFYVPADHASPLSRQQCTVPSGEKR